MALEIYTKYYREKDDKTIVSVAESDPAIFVRFDAELAGKLLDKSDGDLLDKAQDWLVNKYIQEYAAQKLESKVEETTLLAKKLDEVTETVTASILELSNMIFDNSDVLTQLLEREGLSVNENGELVTKQILEVEGGE